MTVLLTIVAIVAGLLVLAPPMTGPTGGRDRPAIQKAARAVEGALQWDALAEFLDAAAYTESRWFPRAGSQRLGTNGALGAWQIRPTSAFPTQGSKEEWTRDQAIAMGPRLLEPKIAAVAIGNYLYRLRGWNQDATWRDLRAAMVFPVFVQGRPTGDAPEKLRARFPTPEKWVARYDLAASRLDEAIAVSGVHLDPDAPVHFPAGPVPLVSELAHQIGVTL
jgi:hypothetical protein